MFPGVFLTHCLRSQETYDGIPGQNKVTFLLQAVRDATGTEEVSLDIHPFIHNHTPTPESTHQGDSQLVRSSQVEASRSGTPRHSASWSREPN